MPDHRAPEVQAQRRRAKIFGPIALLVFAPVWLPLVLIGGAIYGAFAAYLYVAVWLFWCARGANVFLVYSRSPNWQEHIENDILPKLPDSTVVLNWSDRKAWSRFSLRAQVFWHFLGTREHTPAAILFRPFRRARILRFYEGYRAAKHGDEKPLNTMESEFLDLVRANAA
jgi:hypothetical protein